MNYLIVCCLFMGPIDFAKIVIDSNLTTHGIWSGMDIDGDGDYDILITRETPYDEVGWYEQAGEPWVWVYHTIVTLNYSLTSCPMEIASGDFDKDGRPDVVFNCVFYEQLWLARNLGGGNFDTPTLIADTLSGLTYPRQIRVADVDNDGWQDIVIGNDRFDTTAIFWFKNNHNLTFTQNIINTPPPYGPWKIAVLDAGGSGGHLSVAATESFGSGVYLFQNNGSETFTPITISTSLTNPAGIGAADFNHDGKTDIVVTSNNQTLWYKNNGGGSFTSIQIDAGVVYGDGLDVGDLHSTTTPDGNIDVVVCEFTGSSDVTTDGVIKWYENNGSGSFTKYIIDNVGLVNADLPYIVDINQDGCPDIVMTDMSYGVVGHVILYLNLCGGASLDENKTQPRITCRPLQCPAKNNIEFVISLPNGNSEGAFNLYDKTGKLVYEYKNEFSQGPHSLIWNGKSLDGKSQSAGIYFYKFTLTNQQITGKAILLR